MELHPIDELTDVALASCERAFRMELATISRLAMQAAGLSPADGWRLNLNPNTPGYRQFVRTEQAPPGDMAHTEG